MAATSTYCDTSVFGGVFDEEFEGASRAFFDLVRRGRFEILVSDISRAEISSAPKQVRELFDGLLEYMRLVEADERILLLRDEYVSAGIVGRRSIDDAAHVAAATVAGADLIVSWNFRHMVHYEKIRLYNEVNARLRYGSIDIRSPLEVIEYADEEEF
jgi:predicted nucleic acid-binding protein